ncbi:MAG: glycosyltransferase family 2 protein [Deltaproteobacteria bacterium]|nr:glycosyltransferase family 2 protein [Deltaproteobacteria bacterium]
MKLSFLILTSNRYKFLEKCIGALVKSIDNPNSCEIIVMDNGSTDDTSLVLTKFEHLPNLKVIKRKRNYGLNAYKKLFRAVSGENIVVVDDDVLEFPKGIDSIFSDYMGAFQDYGLLALNVVQNEHTNGAKPESNYYTEDIRKNRIVEKGPAGGWCTCFRLKDYKKIRLRFELTSLSMKQPHDGSLARLFAGKLNLKQGIIKQYYCFHACGPYYAKQYGHLDHEIEKYAKSGLPDFVDLYSQHRD